MVDYFRDDNKLNMNNVLFYQNKKRPNYIDPLIDDLHREWFGKWDMLEYRHDFIQFLFPIREPGMSRADPLTQDEAEIFSNDDDMQKRLIKSYELMLDFYGCKLVDEKTGKIKRSENYKERYRNLNYSGHNYLRITRILKCLGICGLEHLKKPFIKHFIKELYKKKELRNIKDSLFSFWLPTLRYETHLIDMETYAEKLSGEKVKRTLYNKEERTWANKCFPDKSKGIIYINDETFYDRENGSNQIILNKINASK